MDPQFVELINIGTIKSRIYDSERMKKQTYDAYVVAKALKTAKVINGQVKFKNFRFDL